MKESKAEASKNNMPSPSGNEPLQNLVVVRPEQPQNPAVVAGVGAGAGAPGNPPIQMTVAERIGVNNIVNEFRKIYNENFASVFQNFEGSKTVEDCVFWICREIDTLVLMRYVHSEILASNILMRRIANAAANGIHPRLENGQPFENHPFDIQMFLMNLSIFVVRYLGR